MRETSALPAEAAPRAILDPNRLLRWIYITRLSVASAIFGSAVFTWLEASKEVTLIASVVFAVTTIFTVVSAGYTNVYRNAAGTTFRYIQSLFDLVLATAVVHVTSVASFSAGASPFSALYILVIASATLYLPPGGGLLIAGLGNVLYIADVISVVGGLPDRPLLFQLTVFAAVALGIAYLNAELRQRGEISSLLLAEHAELRIRAEDILRNIRSGVVTIDARERLVYANPMAERLLSLHLSPLVGQPIMKALADRAPSLGAALVRTVSERVRTSRGEGIVTADGRQFPIGVTTTYIDAEQEGGRTATAIFQDISDPKRIEELRLRAERLEGIAELSASLAHEIKNPLAAIRSAIEQLSHVARTTPDERTLAELVMRESDRLSRLLTDFLDFAKVRVVQTNQVDLVQIAADAARLAGAHPDRKPGVRVVCTSTTADPVFVVGDDDMLHRAVFNLVLNAVQAAPADSEVTIDVVADATDALPGGGTATGNLAAVRVSDRGAGIPPADRDRVFDPFFTTKPNGTGLGLAVVHRAIEAHRGLVLVDSGPAGTRFSAILPRDRSRGPLLPGELS